MQETETEKAYMETSTARKVWAIATVVGVAAFLTFGFIALSSAMGDRPGNAITYVLCLLGLGLGVVGWVKVMSVTPRMHGRRAAARKRLEDEYRQSDD